MAHVTLPESLASDNLACTARNVFQSLFPAEELDHQTSKAFISALCLLTDFVKANCCDETSASYKRLQSASNKKRSRGKIKSDINSACRDAQVQSDLPTELTKLAGEMDFTRYQRRYVALKIMYLGWDYSGFATQNSGTTRTIEVSKRGLGPLN